MPTKGPSYSRVMLLLPNTVAEFVDNLATQLSDPFRKYTRQDVIRETLTKLMLASQPATTVAPKVPRKTRTSK